MNRRQMLYGTGAGALAAVSGRLGSAEPNAPLVEALPNSQAVAAQGAHPLALAEYQPESMLDVQKTEVARSRYPVIDVHTHLTASARQQAGVSIVDERVYLGSPEELLPIMDRRNVRSMVNLTGGYGRGLVETVTRYDRPHTGRFYTFAEPMFSEFQRPDYAHVQAEAIAQAQRDGARGLKILKTLGLYLREGVTQGRLVRIDDPKFDPMWDACAQLQMPVAIHVSDPLAFFRPIDRFNERYEELASHPDWSFYGGDFPGNAELLEARNRVFARHPKTRFLTLHMGNFAENLANVSAAMDRFPNMTVDIAARIGELGRQPRRARAFFEKYEDRVLFGTDATPHRGDLPQQAFGDELYKIYFRFLETDDEYFDYAPAKVPPQGRWKISGIHLPDRILSRVYRDNALRELRLQES